MTDHALPTVSRDVEGTDVTISSFKRPGRAKYLLKRILNTFIYLAIVLFLLFLTMLWTFIITFTVAPIVAWARGADKMFEYYTAPFELQRDVYRSYRATLKQSKKEYDFEKSIPKPMALQKRTFDSVHSDIPMQKLSPLILSLPPEIRRQIYEEVFTADNYDVRIFVYRSRKPDRSKDSWIIHGYRGYSSSSSYRVPTVTCNCYDIREVCHAPHHYWHIDTAFNQRRGLLSLPLTCKQLYTETIGVLYSLPTFHFDYLHHPPFFLYSILPQHLALIRSIRLCYNQTRTRHPCSRTYARKRRHERHHRQHQCSRCNVERWLEIIRKTMKNLQRIEVLVYANVEMAAISPHEPWLSRLFALQRGPNGLRDLRIQVHPIHEYGMPLQALSQESTAQTKRTDEQLQEMIKKGVERYSQKDHPPDERQLDVKAENEVAAI